MNITELLISKPDQRPRDKEIHDNEDKVKLSDFLQYPTLGDPESESDSDDIELRQIIGPEMQHPKAAELIARLVGSTGTLECLEVLHDAYKMYCDGELEIDIEADEWPDFWETVLE